MLHCGSNHLIIMLKYNNNTLNKFNDAQQKVSKSWMEQFFTYFRSRRELKINEKIARLTAEIEFWKGKTELDGTIPMSVCYEISEKIGTIAFLMVRLDHFKSSK